MIDWNELLIYLIFWAQFGILHSILASNTMKQNIPLRSLEYRIAYNFLAGILFLLLLFLLPSITSLLLNLGDLSIYKISLFLLTSGFGSLVTMVGLANWNLPGFVGLATEDDPLKTNGIYAFSRHPVYTGIIIIFLSLLIIEISTNSLSWILGGGGYFVFGSYPEENKLKSLFPEYEEYKKNVGRFFPWNKRHFKFLNVNK